MTFLSVFVNFIISLFYADSLSGTVIYFVNVYMCNYMLASLTIFVFPRHRLSLAIRVGSGWL